LERRLVKLAQEREQKPKLKIIDESVAEIVKQAREMLNQQDLVLLRMILREYLERVEINGEKITM
jgi:replicative DNA helicase